MRVRKYRWKDTKQSKTLSQLFQKCAQSQWRRVYRDSLQDRASDTRTYQSKAREVSLRILRKWLGLRIFRRLRYFYEYFKSVSDILRELRHQYICVYFFSRFLFLFWDIKDCISVRYEIVITRILKALILCNELIESNDTCRLFLTLLLRSSIVDSCDTQSLLWSQSTSTKTISSKLVTNTISWDKLKIRRKSICKHIFITTSKIFSLIIIDSSCIKIKKQVSNSKFL